MIIVQQQRSVRRYRSSQPRRSRPKLSREPNGSPAQILAATLRLTAETNGLSRACRTLLRFAGTCSATVMFNFAGCEIAASCWRIQLTGRRTAILRSADKTTGRRRIVLEEILGRPRIQESNGGRFNISIHMMTDLRFALRQLRKSPGFALAPGDSGDPRPGCSARVSASGSPSHSLESGAGAARGLVR